MREQGRSAINRSSYVADTDERALEIMSTVFDMHRGLVRMLSNQEIIKDGIMHYDPVDDEPDGARGVRQLRVWWAGNRSRKSEGVPKPRCESLFGLHGHGPTDDMVMGSLEHFAKDVMPAFP